MTQQDDTDWIKPSVDAAVYVRVEGVDRFGRVVALITPDGTGFCIHPKHLNPLPTPPAHAAAERRVVEAVTAVVKHMRSKYRNIPSFQLGWGSLGIEVLAATDALLALTTPPNPLEVVLEKVRRIAEMDVRAVRSGILLEMQDEARAAIPIIAAAIKEAR